MQKKTKLLLLSRVAVAILTLLIYTESRAYASPCFKDTDSGINFGNGICDTGEGPDECIELDEFVLEICPTRASINPLKQFPIPSTCGESEESCSKWSYVVTKVNKETPRGIANLEKDKDDSNGKHISFLIPVSNQVLKKNGATTFPPGVGDKTTGFGEFDLSNFVFRKSFSLAPSERYIKFSFKTISALPGAIPALLKGGKKQFGLIQGPKGGEILPISTSAETIQTSEGVTLSYTLDRGTVTSIESTGELPPRLIPVEQLKFCVPRPDLEGLPSIFPDDWICENIEFVTNECDIKTTGIDPCRMILGTCIQY